MRFDTIIVTEMGTTFLHSEIEADDPDQAARTAIDTHDRRVEKVYVYDQADAAVYDVEHEAAYTLNRRSS